MLFAYYVGVFVLELDCVMRCILYSLAISPSEKERDGCVLFGIDTCIYALLFQLQYSVFSSGFHR